MSIAAASCWFSALASCAAVASSHSLTTSRLRCGSCKPHSFTASKSSEDPNHNSIGHKPLRKSVFENVSYIQKYRPSPRDQYPLSNAGGRSTENTTGQSTSISFKSSDVQKKGNKGCMVDSVEQQFFKPIQQSVPGRDRQSSRCCFP